MKFYDGIKLDRAESKFLYKVTGGLTQKIGRDIPRRWLIVVGAGGGKSRFISRLLPYRSMVEFNWPLHPGQEAENILIAPSLQAGMINIEYIESMLEGNEALYNELVPEHPGQKPIIKNSQMARMHFRNGTGIRLSAVTRITGRGRSIWTLILEEAAHFKVEGRFSDEEVYRSASPRMGRFGMDAMCFLITTPWDKSGLVWKKYSKYYGKENENWLVIQGSSKEFNPTISDKFLAMEQEADPQTFKREYLAQFLDTTYGAFSAEAIEDAIVVGRKELPYNSAFKYFAFMDPASLSLSESARFNDEFVSGVAHLNGNKIVLDALCAWKATTDGRRVTPDDAAAESMELFRKYRVKDVMADRVAAGYIEHKFTGLREFKYEYCPLSKSDLYLNAIPIVNDGSVELLDDETTNKQIKGLIRQRGHGSGKDTVIHKKGDFHDDRANVVSGLIYMGRERSGRQATFDLSGVAYGGQRATVLESNARDSFNDIQ